MGDNDKLFSYLSSKVKPTNKPQKNNINPLTGKPMTTEGLPYFIDLAEPVTYPKFNEQVRLLGYHSLTKNPEGLEKKFSDAQSNWEQAGRAIKGFGKQAVGGFLMSAGATADFELGINTVAGIEDEYDNWFLRTGAKLIEETETDPDYQIYEEEPGKLNFGDGAWWFNQFKRTGLSSGIALEAAFETAIVSALTGGTGTGATIAKSGGNINKLANFLKASSRTNQMRRNAMIWAGIRRHGESVIESYYNFHETENELKLRKEKGEIDLSDEQIKKIAANRAADTYRANIPLVVFDLITANALTVNPITGGAMSSTIIDKTINSIKRPLLRKLTAFGVTGMSEGLEEFFQYGISEETGYSAKEEAGLIKDKDKKDFGERLGDYMASDEGWNNFFAGVFGAAVMGGGAKVIHKLGDVVNGKPYASEQKEFVNTMINTGRQIQEQIRLEEESGNATGTDNLRRTLGIHKAITGLELDRLTGKTNSFESYTSYLQDMLETLNTNNVKEINELGITDVEKNKQMYTQYLEDANKIKRIYSDVAQTNMPNAISKITAARFSTEVLTDAQNKINSQINEIKTNENYYKELTPKGKEILDIALSIDALNKNKKQLEKRKEESNNPFVKLKLAEEIAAINNGIKAHNKEYNDLLAEEDTRTENEKDSDVNKIKILRGTNLASLYTELEEVTSKKRQDEKSLVKWMDQKYQTKDFLGITNKKLNRISSIDEVNALRKNKSYEFMTKKQIQKLNDIEKKLKAKKTVEKIESKPSTTKYNVPRTTTVTKEEQAEIEEQNNIQTRVDAKSSKVEDVLDEYIASSMPVSTDAFGIEEELSPSDFDESEFYQEPASLDNVSEEQKSAFKTLAKRLYDAYKEDNNETPSFKGIISKLLQVRSKSDVKPYFDSIYIGWKENNYKLGEDEYYKAYQLFSDFGEIFDEFKAFDNLTPKQKTVEKTGTIQQTQQTKTEPAKQVPIESGDKPIKIKLRTTDENHQFYYLSQEYVVVDNGDGTFEIRTKNPGELYEAPDIDHKRLLDPNFKEGDICTLGIPTNEDFEITLWDEEGNKKGTITLRDLKNTYQEGSDEYIDMMPILIYDKEGVPVAMVHTPDWFNKKNVGLENNTKKQIELINKNIESNRQLRRQLYNSADNNLDRQLSIVVTEKELGSLDKLEGNAPISQMAPNALIGRAESKETLIVYDENGEAFPIHIKDPNVTFATGEKAIARRSQDSFVEGHVYDVRLALIKKNEETGEEEKHYVILNANPTTLTKESQATVLRMLKAFLNDESSNEKLRNEALKIISSYKKATGFNLSVNSEFVAAMKEYVNIIEINWDKGDADYYIREKVKEDGKPFILVGHSKEGPKIFFGIKGQAPYEKAKNNYLFITKETFREGKANAALSYFAKTIIPNMNQNASFPSLKRSSKTYDILVNGDVIESKTSKGTNNYFDRIKDSFTNNVKSHNVGTEENPIWSPIVQPRIRFEVINSEGERVQPIERKTKIKTKETISSQTINEKKADIERRRQEELNNLGQKQLTIGFDKLTEAQTPEKTAKAIKEIEQNVSQGAKLSTEQSKQLSNAKEQLKNDGYEIIESPTYRQGDNKIVQSVKEYEGEILTEQQVKQIENSIDIRERRGLEISVEDLPSPVTRVVKPQLNKDGIMIQAAEVNTIVFDSVEQAKNAIKKSKEAGYKQSKASDKINAKYDAELAELDKQQPISVTNTTDLDLDNILKDNPKSDNADLKKAVSNGEPIWILYSSSRAKQAGEKPTWRKIDSATISSDENQLVATSGKEEGKAFNISSPFTLLGYVTTKDMIGESSIEDSSVSELVTAAINAIGKIGGKANQLSSLFDSSVGYEEPILIEDAQVIEALKGFTANIDKLTPVEEDILTEYLMQSIISKIDEDNYKVDKITEELKSEFDNIISEGENEITLIYDKLSAIYDTDTVKYNKLKQVLSELQKGIEKYDNIKNNWDVLKSLTLDKIQKTTSFEINEDEEDSNPLFDNFDYGKNSFEVNHKTSVSKRLKTFFSGIELTDEEGNVKKGFMNVPLYSKLDDTWDTVEQIISSEEPDSSYEEMVKQLQEYTYAYPWLNNFITKLENAPGHVKNEFVYEMTKHVLSMKFIMFSKDKGKDTYTTRVFNTNSADLNRSIISSWWDNAKHPNNGLIDYVNGEFIVSKEKAKSLLEQFKSWSDEKSPKYINENDVKENKEELDSLIKKEKDSITLTFSNPKVNNKLAGKENHIVIIGKNRFLFEPVGKNTYKISTIKKTEVPNNEIIDWLTHFGINVSNDTINEIKEKGLVVAGKKYTLNDLFLVPDSTKSTNLFGILVKYLKGAVSSEEPLKFDEEGNDNAHPLKELNTSRVLRELAKMESKYTKYNVTKSFRDNKKSIYGFTATKFSTDRIKKLKKDPVYLETVRKISFHKHSMLLELMANNEEIKNKIQIDHLGLTAIKNRSSKAYKDTKINKLSPYDLRADKAGFFFDTKQGKLEERRFNLPMRMARIMVPLAPDKTGATMLSMPVFNLYESDIMQNEQLSFSDSVKDAIYSQLILPELERILSVAKRKTPSGIKNYDEGSKIFTMFPMLNTMTHEDSTVLDLIHNGGMSLSGFEKVFKIQAINIVVENLMKQSLEKARLYKETFVRNNKKGTPIIKILDKDYFEKGRGEGKNIDTKLLIAATDMTINTAIAHANMFMSIIGDPAYFQNTKDFKSNFKTENDVVDVTKPLSKNSYLNVVEKLDENMGKRLAMLIAPRKILANSKGQIYNQLMINDALDVSENMLFLISENYPEANLEKAKTLLSQLYESKEESVRKAKREELEKMFPDIAEYLKIESTDAQEYVTVKEAAYVKYKKGQMTETDYNNIIKKSKEQRAFEKKYPNREIPEHLLLTNYEKKLILGPEKPVYTGQIIDNTNDTMRTVYIKSSAVPLIPEFTIGKSINKVRIALEQYEEKYNTYLRASYQTANKVGANIKALSIFNSDGSIMDINQDTLGEYIVTLNREDFGIQQEVPYKEDKDRISIGTQTVKLLFGDGVMNMTGFKYNNKTLSGKELYTEYNKLFENLIQENKKQLYSELGIDMNTNMPIDVKTSMKKVNDLLIKEAKNRNFPKQDIESLELIEIVNKTGGINEMTFKLPLWSAANSNRYESMLLSIIRKRLINIKLPGASFATMSETGFNYIEDINQIEKRYQNKIIHTSVWNGKELQASVNEDGSYHAQIMMPSKFRDNEGNLINLFKKVGNTYMYIEKSENGWKLKEGMIQKELLQLFSFRIPTSSHVSMSSVEIVGFLPENLGDVVLLPKNFTKKMGLDFDIDKQYHYNLWTQMKEDGSIVELPEGIDASKTLENNIIKIHNAVLSHPSVQKKHNKVLSTDDAKKQSNIINDKINSTVNKSDFTFLSDEYQSDKVLSGASGGMAIGIYSNYVTLHSLIQQANVMGNNIHMYEVVEKQPVPFSISIAGRTNTGGTLGNQDTIDGQRSISEVLGELQNTALDNLKLLILGKTNINDITINAATLLVLLGFDKTNDFVTLDNETKEQLSIPYLFTSQPVIREYVKQMKNSKAVFEDFNANREEDIISNLETMFGFSLGESDNRILSSTSGQDLYDNLTSSNPETQREVLSLFLTLTQYGNTLTSFQSLFNINKSGAGKSMFEAIDKFERLKDINSNFGFKNLGSLIGEFAKIDKDNTEEDLKEKGFVQIDEVFIKPTTVTGHMIVEGLTTSYNLWSKYFPYNTKLFKELYLRSLQGLDTEELSSKKTTEFREELFRDLKRYWNSNAIGTFTGDPNIERKRLFLEENGLSLASYTSMLKNTRDNDIINESIKGNALINSITPVIRKKGNLSTMEFNNTGNDAIQDEYKYIALLDLIGKKDRLPDFNYNESIFYEEIDITEKKLSKEILNNIENDIQDGLFVSEKLSEEDIAKFKYKDKSYKLIYKGYLNAEEISKETSLSTITLNSTDTERKHVYEIQPFYTTRDYARDIISYAYLEGGVQEAIQFVKYVPVSVLESLGYSDIMRLNHNVLSSDNMSSFNIDRFLRQRFQHNPNLAVKLDDIQIEAITEQQKVKGISQVDKFSINENMPFDKIKYVTVYNPSSIGPTYILFENDGTGVFYKIPVLGEFGMVEYNSFADVNKSILSTKEELQIETPKKVKSSLEIILDKIESPTLKDIIKDYDTVEGYLDVLVDYIGEDVKVKIDNDMFSSGLYKNGTIFINTKASPNITKTLIHELSHAATVKYLNQYFALDPYTKEHILKMPVEDMPDHAKNFYRIFNEAKNRTMNHPKYKEAYITMKQKIKNKEGLGDVEKVVYSVQNIFEFVPAIIENKVFIEDIGSLEYKETGKSIRERFKEAFENFMILLGVKDNTILKSALNNLFSFIETEKELSQNKEGLTQADKRAAEYLNSLNTIPEEDIFGTPNSDIPFYIKDENPFIEKEIKENKLFTTKINQFTYTYDPTTKEVIHKSKTFNSKANIPQNLVSGEEKYGTYQEATNEVKQVLGNNPHSIDMIEKGFRTRTTRSASEMEKYNIKVGDIVKHFGTSSDGSVKNIYTKITAIHPKGTPEFFNTWEKEGWTKEGLKSIERYKDGAAAIEFEIIDSIDVLETNPTQINKVLAAYAKENNYTIKEFNNQQYVKINGKILNVNNGNEVTQKQILDLFEDLSEYEEPYTIDLSDIKVCK